MLYDESLKNTGRVEFVLNDNSKIVLRAMASDEMYEIVMFIPKETSIIGNVITPYGTEKNVKNESLFICANVSINLSNVGISVIADPRVIITTGILPNGREMYSMVTDLRGNQDRIPLIFDFNNVKEINADPKLWVILLNEGLIDTTDKGLKKYNALPKTRIYGLDKDGKPKVKKYVK